MMIERMKRQNVSRLLNVFEEIYQLGTGIVRCGLGNVDLDCDSVASIICEISSV